MLNSCFRVSTNSIRLLILRTPKRGFVSETNVGGVDHGDLKFKLMEEALERHHLGLAGEIYKNVEDTSSLSPGFIKYWIQTYSQVFPDHSFKDFLSYCDTTCLIKDEQLPNSLVSYLREIDDYKTFRNGYNLSESLHILFGKSNDRISSTTESSIISSKGNSFFNSWFFPSLFQLKEHKWAQDILVDDAFINFCSKEDLYLSKFKVYFETNNYEEYIRCFNDYLIYGNGCPDIFHQAFYILCEQKDYKRAIDCYIQLMIQNSPPTAENFDTLVSLLVSNKNYNQAITISKEYQSQNLNLHPNTALTLLTLYLRIGDYEPAHEIIDRYFSSESPKIISTLIKHYCETLQIDKAFQLYSLHTAKQNSEGTDSGVQKKLIEGATRSFRKADIAILQTSVVPKSHFNFQ